VRARVGFGPDLPVPGLHFGPRLRCSSTVGAYASVRSLAVDRDGDYSRFSVKSPPDLPGNRRTHARAPIELRVEYKRVNTFFADYTKNISRGGTFIGTQRPLPVGTEFVFALAVPSLSEPLRLRGKVVWITPPEDASPANPAGMGIEFQYSGSEERREKESAVERLLIAELGEQLATKLLGRAPQK